jgi:hypothetical protein
MSTQYIKTFKETDNDGVGFLGKFQTELNALS